jgi:hypothetical protein
MTDERRFEELLAEFERIGVDLHSFPAGLTVSREEALNILRSLPADAGPAAFLARVREVLQNRTTPPGGTPQQSLEGVAVTAQPDGAAPASRSSSATSAPPK